MTSAVSEGMLSINSDEVVSDEEERGRESTGGGGRGGEEGYASDEDEGSYSSSAAGSMRRSRPSSYTNHWPQSYRQSIDIYSNVTSPSIGFLGTPTLSRLGSSFLTSSFRGKHTPEIFSSFLKPLLPSKTDEHDQQEQLKKHEALIPPFPTRKHSIEKDTSEHKPSSIIHDLPISRDCTYSQAVLNGINVLCGVGILSAPNAVKQGGWVGLTILLIIAILAWYTGILLRACLDSEPGLETYPDIGQKAFGTTGRFVVSIILYLELYACCVEYIILESDNLTSLFPNAQLNLCGVLIGPHLLFSVLTTLIVLPTTWLRDLSILSYISAGGVIATILVVISLVWLGVIDQIGFKNEGTTLNLTGLPIAIGLYGYCFSGHAIFPNIYSSLKKPDQFPSILSTCFVISTVLFAGVAVVGYLMFGEHTESQFTLNMPQNFLSSKIAVWTTVVNPITKYALTLTPLALSLEELIPSDQLKIHIYAIIIRSALALSTLLVALSVPFFGLVMALIGSLLTMLLAFILPCACFLSILRNKVTWSQLSICLLTIGVGIVCSAIGSYSALSRIIQSLSR